MTTTAKTLIRLFNMNLKFRVWDQNDKRFLNSLPSKLYFKRNDNWWAISEFIQNQNFSVNLFTGLSTKDCDIYEGDILRIRTNDNPEDLEWEVHAVIFKDGAFYIGEEPLSEWIIDEEIDAEIIGNIYENPELCLN